MAQEADTYVQKAKEKFRDSDVEGAIQELNHAISLEPDNIEYHLLRGDYLYRLDKHQLALEDFTKVIDSTEDKNDLEIAYSKLAHCHRGLRQFHETILDLDWLIEHGFATANKYAWRAELKTELGYLEDAINDYTVAHQMAPEAEDFLLGRAHTNYAAKQYNESLNDLNEMLSSKKQFSPMYLAAIYYWRAKVHYKLGVMSEALSDFNENMRLSGKEIVSNISDCVQILDVDS